MTPTRLFVLFLILVALSACANTSGQLAESTTPEPSTPVQQEIASPITAEPSLIPDSPLPTTISSNHLSSAAKMNVKRAAHTATLLADGTVLIVGGFREEGTSEIPIASAEIYNPITAMFTPIGSLNEARSGHTATLLPDGRVLIAGGWGPNGRTATAELYDPQTGEFSYTAGMSSPRAGMTATLLTTGQVLIAGGESARNRPQLMAELYDPLTDTFLQSGSLNNGRAAHTATLLDNGNVLLIGGSSNSNTVLASAEIYHPTTGQFTLTGSLNAARHKHAAVLLQDGNVLVVGGSDQNDWRGKYTSAEMYDPETGIFTSVADLNEERFKLADAVVRLHNGNVLIGGGNRQLELFDANDQRFLLGEKLDSDYYFSVLTLLVDGRVLITGGYDPNIQPTDKAWIYH